MSRNVIEHFPSLLRELRRSADLSQLELAKKAGVPTSLISHLETGRRRPSPRHRERLSEALNVTPDELAAVPDGEEALLRLYRRLPRDSQEIVERILALFVDIAEEQEEAATSRRQEWFRQQRAKKRKQSRHPRKELKDPAKLLPPPSKSS